MMLQKRPARRSVFATPRKISSAILAFRNGTKHPYVKAYKPLAMGVAMVSDDVRSVVNSVIREQLDNIDIRQVETERDEGYYGEDILRVTVTVNSPASAFDGDKLSGLVRHLRPRLEDVHENAFPMVQYRSVNDPR